jgi:phage-related baseplate assembly protein
MSQLTLDLSRLAPPDVVETLDFEALYQELLADFRMLYPDYSAVLESDPVVKLLELAAYREMLLRARVNDAARSNLLAFAAGSDLDHLAAFYGVARIGEEADSRLRLRTQFQIAAIAGNGTTERYAALALTANPSVKDAAVLSRQPGTVDVALWITDLPEDAPLPPDTDYPEANVAHHATVLAAVTAVFDADDQRILGVPLTVYEAIPVTIDIVATIYREAQAQTNLTETLAANLPARMAAHAELGHDVPISLIMSWLHVAGVSRVELVTPDADIALPYDGYAVAGEITLTDGGVAW